MEIDHLKLWVTEQQSQIEAVLKQLVEMNTYTANRVGVDKGMDALARIAADHGLTVEVVNARHRLIKAGDGKRKPRVLLVAHMDTVFPPDGDFLHYEDIGDGFVRGPGVGDIKGGLVMGLWSMLALRELSEHFDVQLIVSADEENGSPSIRDWYLGGHIGADYAIGLEPGFPQGDLTPTVPLGVVEKRRGYGAIRWTVTGKACHSGTPWLGLNAIEAAAQRITRIHALTDYPKGVTTTVGMINGGISPNTVAGEVKGTASFRFETQADGNRVKAAIEEILGTSYVTNEDLNLSDTATFETDAFIPPMEKNERNQHLVDIVLGEAERLGQNVVPIARGGGSDANFISASGTPAICGMGAPAEGIHTTDEKIYLPGLFNRIELLTATVYRLIETSDA